jgi:hypothetical protein
VTIQKGELYSRPGAAFPCKNLHAGQPGRYLAEVTTHWPKLALGKALAEVRYLPSAELPLSGRKGRSQRKTGPDEMGGRTAACGNFPT